MQNLLNKYLSNANYAVRSTFLALPYFSINMTNTRI